MHLWSLQPSNKLKKPLSIIKSNVKYLHVLTYQTATINLLDYHDSFFKETVVYKATIDEHPLQR